MNKKAGLGRGLSALMAEIDTQPAGDTTRPDQPNQVPIEHVHPNPDQPRRQFTENDLADLAASIREKGVIQPLIVRPLPASPGQYQIVAGERRWRAAQLARLTDVPVVVREFSDIEVLEVAIIENVQRADLNPIEEATGYRQLMDRFGHTQERVAEALGKSRSHIANLLRLLSLPESVLALVREGQLSAGHARALVPVENPSALARQVVKKQLSVRQTEKLVKDLQSEKPKRPAKVRLKDADTAALEGDLSANLGMKVAIDHPAGKPGGSLTITYASLDELDQLCRMINTMPKGGSI